jgi:hypothetical protein
LEPVAHSRAALHKETVDQVPHLARLLLPVVALAQQNNQGLSMVVMVGRAVVDLQLV